MIDSFAFYFPQLYPTKENSEWWGEDFTDWDLVKKATPKFSNHHQPRVPLHDYYDQSLVATLKHQADLARKYGISGFNFYHYWFDGTPHLDIPINNLLNDKSINIKYMLTWANESWTRQWIGKPNDVLIKQNYYKNNGDIKNHYTYLSQFFKDPRYCKIDNKPVLSFYRPELIPDLQNVIHVINDLAKCDGFDGIYLLACRSYEVANPYRIYSSFDGIINFNPRFAINFHFRKKHYSYIERIARSLPETMQSPLAKLRSIRKKLTRYKYEDFITSLNESENFFQKIPVYHSVFPDWDNTARYNDKATLFTGTSNECYEKALQIAVKKLTNSHEKIIFINAWNEWSEGAYLEPDKKNGYFSLQITKNTLNGN